MDTFSRKIVGWPIDTVQDSNLVVNALDVAIENRDPPAGGIVAPTTGSSSPPGRSPTRFAPPD